MLKANLADAAYFYYNNLAKMSYDC